jgi:hypothetical protein
MKARRQCVGWMEPHCSIVTSMDALLRHVSSIYISENLIICIIYFHAKIFGIQWAVVT